MTPIFSNSMNDNLILPARMPAKYTNLLSDPAFPAQGSLAYPQFTQGVQGHPYYKTYTDFQQPFSLFAPSNQSNYGNRPSTSYQHTVGEFPVNSNYRYAAGFQSQERFVTLFSNSSVKWMSQMITQLLQGLHPEGKRIVVPDATILSVADSVYQNTGQSVQVMQEMVINFIVDNIKTEFETLNKNNNLSIWVTKYDQESGLKQFNDVKLNNRRRNQAMQWKY